MPCRGGCNETGIASWQLIERSTDGGNALTIANAATFSSSIFNRISLKDSAGAAWPAQLCVGTCSLPVALDIAAVMTTARACTLFVRQGVDSARVFSEANGRFALDVATGASTLIQTRIVGRWFDIQIQNIGSAGDAVMDLFVIARAGDPA